MLYPSLLIPGPVSVSLSVRDAMRLPVLSSSQTEYRDLLRLINHQLLTLYSLNADLWVTALTANAMNSVRKDIACELVKERSLLSLFYSDEYFS